MRICIFTDFKRQKHSGPGFVACCDDVLGQRIVSDSIAKRIKIK